MKGVCTYIIFILIFFSQAVFAAAGKEKSSEELRLQEAHSKARDAKSLAELENYVNQYYDQPEVIVYIESLLSGSLQEDSLSASFKALSELMVYCYNHKDTGRYEFWIDRIDSLSEMNKINPAIAYDAHRNKASYMLAEGHYVQVVNDAIVLYNKAHKNDNKYGMICGSDILGMIYYYSRRDSAAIVTYQDVLAGLENLGGHLSYRLRVLSYLVELNLRLGNLAEVKDYLSKYEQILDLRNAENKEKNVVHEVDWYKWLMHSFYVDLFLHQDNLEDAEKELSAATTFYKQGMHPREDYSVYYYLYVKASHYKKLKKYKEALSLVNFILDNDQEIDAMLLKADILFETGEFEETLVMYNKLYKIAVRDNSESLVRQINNLSVLYDINEQSVRERELQLNNIQVNEKRHLIIYTTFASFILLVLLSVLLWFFVCTHKLKNALEIERNSLVLSENNLKDEKKNAEIANLLKNAFIANISHEIRTPLNAIVGFSNLLSDPETEETEKQGFVDLIGKNTDTLLNLVNDVLDLSRLESGTAKLTIEPCDVVGCCREALSNIRYKLSPGIKLTFDTPVETFTIPTASLQLCQLLSRLLDNAAKFTKEGEINLSFYVDKEAHQVRFSVTDTGPGIPLDKQGKVFERFEKLDEFSQGSGLGLSICKIIAEHLEGKLLIDPDYTDGVRFVFIHSYTN